MNQCQPFSAHHRQFVRYGRAALLCCALAAPQAVAASASEQANLDVMIRQLNALEDTARRSARVAEEPGQRYFFDYQRLASDIQRVRQGLQNYLTPRRAQPRDPVELSGNYTLTGGRMP